MDRGVNYEKEIKTIGKYGNQELYGYQCKPVYG